MSSGVQSISLEESESVSSIAESSDGGEELDDPDELELSLDVDLGEGDLEDNDTSEDADDLEDPDVGRTTSFVSYSWLEQR